MGFSVWVYFGFVSPARGLGVQIEWLFSWNRHETAAIQVPMGKLWVT
jgi:hypothetical protein